MCSAFIANSICTAIQRGWSSHVGQWGSILVRRPFLGGRNGGTQAELDRFLVGILAPICEGEHNLQDEL
jgi:hypothetical protein